MIGCLEIESKAESLSSFLTSDAVNAMTIICSFQYEGGAVLVGDLMVSGSREQASPLDIPTRFSKAQPDVNLYFSQLSQKVVIINNGLAVAWAGQKIVAKHLIQRIANEVTAPYTPEKILALIYGSGLLAEELESVSFIFFGLLDAETNSVFVQDYLTGETILDDKTKFKYAGSGAYHFLDCIQFNIKGIADDLGVFDRSLGAIIGRLAIALYDEVISDITHNFFYGGGFELLFFDHTEKKFFKIPMTFVFWEYNDHGFSLHGPIVTLNYDSNGYLFLHRIARNEQGKLVLKTYSIGNVLNESAITPSPPLPSFNTSCSVHYFTSSQSGSASMMIHGDDPKNFTIEYSPDTGDIDVEYSETFVKEARFVLTEMR